MVTVLHPCCREIAALPDEIRGDIADAVARLEVGLMLSMPLSRPMPSVGRGVHELRLNHRSGTYRIVYAVGRDGQVILVHAFKKTTRATPVRSMTVARQRIRRLGR